MTILTRTRPLSRVIRQIIQRDNGCWLDASDLSTMYQDAAGTTPVTAMEQPVGLWLDKSQGLQLGPELVTNGDFSQGATGWNTYMGSPAVVNSELVLARTAYPDAASVSQLITFDSSKYYICSFKSRCNDSASGVQIWLNGTSYYLNALPISKIGGYNQFVFKGAGSDRIRFYSINNNTTIYIDNISVRELKGNHATQSITASRPVVSARKNLLTKTEDFADAAWSKSNTTLSSGNVIENAVNSQHTLSVALGSRLTIPTCILTISAKVKPNGCNIIVLSASTGRGPYAGVHFDLMNKTIVRNTFITSDTYVAGSAKIADAGDGYVIVSAAFSQAATTSFYPEIKLNRLNIANQDPVYIGDGVSGVAVKYMQLEYGTSATRYQRVSTATDYDTVGFPTYLSHDLVDDALNLNIDFGADAMLAIAVDGNVSVVDDNLLSSPSLYAGQKLYGVLAIDRNTTPHERKMVKLLLGDRYFGTPVLVNDIGIQGDIGYGVGICPALPAGYTELAGTQFKYDEEYGNYRYSDGSIQCWVPAFYARIGHASNATYATYGVNSVDTKPYSYFADKATANAAGYFLPRCFIDGGVIKDGVFVDKYMCSNNGGIASSIKNGNPLSSAADHNPFSGLTGAPSNAYGGAWAAAKTRGSRFFVCSRFIYAALALLSLAHGQAATATTNCAWYDATGVTNFPKGCNNNALKDANDTAVTYTSDGYSNCGKTGSGVPFAKTTHNGQACGIADLNGLMWEISQGVTCIATSKTITAATQTNPVSLTITGHGMTTGAQVQIQNVAGMTQLNDKIFIATVVDANTITLNGVDGTAFTAYTSGGSATYGAFYVAKESAQMANFTGGNTLSTDHFGGVGVAANMDAFTPAFATTYSSNGFAQKLGNGANQVLSPDLTGNNAVLRSLGVPMAEGMSTSGSNLFGQDYFYQYIRNELCLLSGAYWLHGSYAGVWASLWAHARADSLDFVGFRAASYL